MQIMHRLGFTPPTPFLPNAVKDSPGRGWGNVIPGNRTVTHCRVFGAVSPSSRRGKCCPFFLFLCFLCLVRCLLPFFAVLLRVAVRNLSGANFCFWVLVLVMCVFLAVTCLGFCFMLWRFVPESVWKNSLDVRSAVFWVRSLFLWFFLSTSSWLFFKRYRSGSNRTPHARACFVCSCFFCPAALVVSPFLAVRPASWRFSGCHSGPRAFLGFSYLRGLSSLAPSEALFLGREAARVFLCFSCLVFLFPLFFVLRPRIF